MMLLVWAGLLGLAVVLWFFLRLLFGELMAAWQHRRAESEEQWDRDLWAPSVRAERDAKYVSSLVVLHTA